MVSGLRDGVGQGQSEGLEGDLCDRVDGEVRFDAGTRGAYSTDASNFRQVPVGQLAEHVRAGGYVVGLEPSCTAVFRSDAAELFPDDQDVLRLRDHTVTLAELLTEHTPGWEPPRLTGREVLAQVHCHQHAVLGWHAEAGLLESAGAKAEHLDSGCRRGRGSRRRLPGDPAMTAASAGGTGRAPGVLTHPAGLGGPPAVLP